MEEHARGYGLDFFPTIFEMVDYDQLNAIAAYGGFPTALSALAVRHGVRAARQGLHLRAAENLRAGDQQRPVLRLPDAVQRASTDQKLVMAHVYGHCDFFKNNYWFSQTNRKMMDEMANHGNRVRRYMDRFGVEEVETFIDACLSVEDLIDIHSPFIKRRDDATQVRLPDSADEEKSTRRSPAGSRPRTTWSRSSIRPDGWRRKPKQLRKEQDAKSRISRRSRCAM